MNDDYFDDDDDCEAAKLGAAWAKKVLEQVAGQGGDASAARAFEAGAAWARGVRGGKPAASPKPASAAARSAPIKAKPKPIVEPKRVKSTKLGKPAPASKAVRAHGGVEIRPGVIRYSGAALTRLLQRAGRGPIGDAYLGGYVVPMSDRQA